METVFTSVMAGLIATALLALIGVLFWRGRRVDCYWVLFWCLAAMVVVPQVPSMFGFDFWG